MIEETRIDMAEDLVARVVEAAHVIRDNVSPFERCRHSIVRRYQLCNAFNERHIVMHLGSYDRYRNPVECQLQRREDHRANHMIPPFWLDDRPPLVRHVDVRPAAGWSVWALQEL
ncbi:hypothetical protein ANN_09136 [Periplaneta americana]|uniref:Uncharacterized protein n=1 Tax=Periplaneta americana TaxID=6978 RepID=A0ABQ8TP21_PERAM|nr:hypothetical protein ANN_09136 [Periplaneta americana]